MYLTHNDISKSLWVRHQQAAMDGILSNIHDLTINSSAKLDLIKA
jgi:hypothetical protein